MGILQHLFPLGIKIAPKTLYSMVFGPESLNIRLMDKILHDPKDPKLWELWYIPYNG